MPEDLLRILKMSLDYAYYHGIITDSEADAVENYVSEE